MELNNKTNNCITKAKNVMAAARILVERYGGEDAAELGALQSRRSGAQDRQNVVLNEQRAEPPSPSTPTCSGSRTG